MGEKRMLGWPTWIGVVADDLEGQRRFWAEVLGRPEAASGSDYVQFEMGRARIFELIKRSSEPEYDRPRFQVGFAVEDIDRARDMLLRQGVEPVTEIIRGAHSSWAYFRDPEGNLFEITLL